MNERKELQEYPTPGACILVFVLTFLLTVTIGSILQYIAPLPGIYVTEWLLILGPPILLLWMKKVNIKETLKLQKFKITHILLGIAGGFGIYFISVQTVFFMEEMLGPYPLGEFFEEIFPTTWLGFIPWIFAIVFSAGICEEILYRGFIQNGLHNHWGPVRALIVATMFFTVAHLDPWRTPAVILIGLLAGYLLIRTGSLYAAIAVHMTANAVGNGLAFAEMFPEGINQWLVVLALSLVLVFVVLVITETQGKE